MDPNTDGPTAAPWWQSRIIWTQIIAGLFAISGLINMFTGYDVIGKFNLDAEKILTAIMLIVPMVTIFIRVTHPMPIVTGSKAEAAKINREADRMQAAARGPGDFGAESLQSTSASRQAAKSKTRK